MGVEGRRGGHRAGGHPHGHHESCFVFWGILFIIPGFILIMVGYVDKPSFSKESSFYEGELQRLNVCRLIGWFLFPIGIVLLVFGIILICVRRQNASLAANRQGAGNRQQPDKSCQVSDPPPSSDASCYIYPPVRTHQSGDVEMTDPSGFSQGSAGMDDGMDNTSFGGCDVDYGCDVDCDCDAGD